MIKIGDKILDQDLNITSEYRTKEELEKINRGHGEGEVIKTFSLNHFFVRFEGYPLLVAFSSTGIRHDREGFKGSISCIKLT